MSALNNKILIGTGLVVVLLGLLTLLIWVNGSEGGMSDFLDDSEENNATSTATTTATGNGQVEGGSNQPGQVEAEPVDWSRYAGVETYQYEHAGLGYTFAAPVSWGYFDVDEEENPMNAWFFLTDERELRAADREELKDSTDARLRIITVSKLPIGGEDRAKTLEAVTGYTGVPNFEPTGSSVAAIRQGRIDTQDKSTDGVAYSFLMKNKSDGFVTVEAVYKNENGKQSVEEFVYSLANTFER